MTKELKHLTAEKMEELAPRLASIGRIAESLHNGDVMEDQSNEWAALMDEAEALERWAEENDVDDSLLWDITGFAAEAATEGSYDDLRETYKAVEAAMAVEPAEKVYRVRDKEYTEADLLLCVDIAVELMKDTPNIGNYQRLITRKVEALKANFTVKGFRRTVEDLDLIRRKLAEEQES
jgi:hypothetical protein